MTTNKNNRGAVWDNTRKEKDSQPDYTGSLDVEGVQYWVSMWNGEAGEKQPKFTLSLKKK